MSARDVVLATLTSICWGLGFVAGRIGLDSFSPAQLTTLRFLVACLPVVLVPRPPVPWASIVLIGATLFTGQFLLFFFALAHGLPPGLASVSQQMHAFFTVALAAVFLGDVPDRRQCAGMAVAGAGLVLIGSTAGADLTLTGLGLGLAAAFSWAIGSVLVKRLPTTSTFGLMVWCSLIPPLPSMLVSVTLEPSPDLLHAVLNASWAGLGAVVYLGVFATVGAYAVWGDLLQRHPAAVVAPFALVAPCAGVVASALILGERFGPRRLAGMALILAGLAIVLLAPARRRAVAPGVDASR